jgi:predicted helicase
MYNRATRRGATTQRPRILAQRPQEPRAPTPVRGMNGAMPLLRLEANHKAIKNYFRGLKNLSLLDVTHEGAVRTAFQELLGECARRVGWNLVTEHPIARPKRPALRVDGAIVDSWNIPRGYWEAKDEHNDLKEEVKKKIAVGYPTDNILFQAPTRAILYQNGRQVLDESLVTPDNLVKVLLQFFRYQAPEHDQWELAADEFKTRVPELAKALLDRIELERKASPHFVKAFTDFLEVCRRSINPKLSEQEVEEMLLQHILTERIFRKAFDNPDFIRRNPIATEIEKVIDSLTSRAFNRDKFLNELDRFYWAIERAAASIEDFTEKQHFLNTVYEKFFQGFSVKIADTHGIVYTPQPMVRFMVRSVDEILKKEFGKSLGSKGVHVVDPFVGTGNFILNVMRQMPRTLLAHKYEHELHANELMLLPYYVASLNIEHEYSALMDDYKPFEGLCLVDTFELAEEKHPALFTEKNTERVERQRRSPIFVVIGNPPYNAGQEDDNDRNRNRRYPTVDKRIAETYTKSSKATLVNTLGDPYVRAIRWASDRIGDTGIVAFVTNSSYLEKIPFDGMREHLQNDFDAIYCLDLGGDVRKNPKLSGTTHNVFGVQVGICIGIFVKNRRAENPRDACHIYYAQLSEFARKTEKLKFLDAVESYSHVEWRRLSPDSRNNWITEDLVPEYYDLVPIGVKSRLREKTETGTIFRLVSNGPKSNNDSYAYDFSLDRIERRSADMVAAYKHELRRSQDSDVETRKTGVENFIRVNESELKWIRSTRRHLARGHKAHFDASKIRVSTYRPYCKLWYFFDACFNEDLYQFPRIFPTVASETENKVIVVTGHSQVPFSCQAVSTIPCVDVGGRPSQCFPFYTYDEDGAGRRENITDWALAEFRRRYRDDENKIGKWDVFHYIYAVLHHPGYRHKYEANLRRELPRVPYAPEFWAFANAGKRLAEIHTDYEKQPEYELERVEDPEAKLSWRAERMRLSKDRLRIVYNEFLTLAGIPPEVFEYRIGSRSALEWVIDQYHVRTDPRSGISHDPNRTDDAEYIIRHIGQVITVSLETVHIVRGLPPCEKGGSSAAEALANIAVLTEQAGPERSSTEPVADDEPEPPTRAPKRKRVDATAAVSPRARVAVKSVVAKNKGPSAGSPPRPPRRRA